MVNHLTSRFSLPLLMKELIEQSARRRLFVMRVLYALLLYVLAIVYLVPLVSGSRFTPVNMLGFGRELYGGLVLMQFLGIYLFLPAISCGVITVEKERNTLALLFLTNLSPNTIIFEKLGSRLMVMLNLLMTSLPLLAFTYALGGTNIFDLVCGLWFLGLSTLLVASLGILASAYFRSTITAFLWTYAILFLVSFGPAILDSIVMPGVVYWSMRGVANSPLFFGLFANQPDKMVHLSLAAAFPPGLFITSVNQSGVSSLSVDFSVMLLSSIPTLCLVMANIILAQRCLVPRAFLPPFNPLLNFFKELDILFHLANKRFTRGVVLVKESQSLPDWRPVAWRETAKRSLGQFRYLVRVLLVLEFPTLFFILQSATPAGANSVSTTTVSVVLGVLWIIVALLVSTSAANLVTGERSRQTLEVLLTSPMTSRQIILEKMSGVRRLMAVCAIPLLTCIVFQTWWRWQLEGRDPYDSHSVQVATSGYRSEYFIWHEYLISGLLTVLTYLPLIAWLSLWMGIRSKSPARAILGALAALIGWCALPAILTLSQFRYLYPSPASLQQSSYSLSMLALLDSPAMLILFTEIHGLHWLHVVPYLAALVNALVYGTCWLVIRRHVLCHADQYLGRGAVYKPDAQASASALSSSVDPNALACASGLYVPTP